MILKDALVVEIASVLAGPSVGMFLAELGAEVIKIEHPLNGGDVTRSWRVSGEAAAGGRSSYFNAINWGKRTEALNAKDGGDRSRLLELIRRADIVLVSFKPGDAEKLGLSWEVLRAENPRLIYAAITGYGEGDPRTAYDALLQAETGFMHLNREPGGSPMKMPVALIDVLAAHHLKQLVLIAWIQRMQTGEGTKVEVSLFEAAVSSLVNQAGAWLYAGAEPQPLGSEHPQIYPYGGSFTTACGRAIVPAVGNDAQFRSLCTLLGAPELPDSPDYATNPARSANRDGLRIKLQELFAAVPEAEEFLQELHQARVPAAMIRSISEALGDYRNGAEFALHESKDGAMTGLPQLTGRISGARVSRNLSEPPCYPFAGRPSEKS
ncbi:MAG: CoA transferase [Candidatus Cyclonatronum sp.]|uniref:CaiB/BaiF CoA transferase family protein n=1 Tax=Cyclonatronum sp. TaxID=3024185 RepID=UPI0025BFE90E|nr:CoA transferase [Cyclonatronum sp.]MCH8485649.1 CoA transferase [Cyclonatronum sp.]